MTILQAMNREFNERLLSAEPAVDVMETMCVLREVYAKRKLCESPSRPPPPRLLEGRQITFHGAVNPRLPTASAPNKSPAKPQPPAPTALGAGDRYPTSPTWRRTVSTSPCSQAPEAKTQTHQRPRGPTNATQAEAAITTTLHSHNPPDAGKLQLFHEAQAG